MSEAAAPTAATTPAAPAATATEAPTAVAPVPSAAPPDAGATTKQDAKASGRQRARDLAGKFLQGGRDMSGPDAPAVPKVEAEAAPSEVAKAAEPEKPAEAKKPDPKDDPEERSWKEIRRRKKAQREQQSQLAADRAAVAADKERHASWKAEQLADAELKQKDAAAWIEKHGFDFREVALREVQKQQLTPEQKASREELDAIRAELAAERAAREKDAKESSDLITEFKAERAAKEQKAALGKLHEEAKTEWSSGAAEFPTLAAYYTSDEISETATQLRLDHYRQTKREAPLDEVFAFMETNATREHQRFSRQQAQAAAERAERDTAATSVAKPRAKVGPPVTNQVAATRASPDKPLTEADKRARAVAKAAELMGPRH